MVDWILFALTLIACVYSIYCYKMWKIFESGFITVVKIAYNPQTEEECAKIVETLKNEYFGFKGTTNK